MAGICQSWIPNFGVIAKPLYEATKGHNNEPLECTGETNHAYKTLKKALIEALALGSPNLAKSFLLYMSEKRRISVGILTQKL
jgi:hypothetical protein